MTVLEDFPFVFLLVIRIADRCISRHLGRLSVDISVAISVESTLVESRRIESRTRVGCYTPSVDSRSMVGRLKKFRPRITDTNLPWSTVVRHGRRYIDRYQLRPLTDSPPTLDRCSYPYVTDSRLRYQPIDR